VWLVIHYSGFQQRQKILGYRETSLKVERESEEDLLFFFSAYSAFCDDAIAVVVNSLTSHHKMRKK
jgi:hypothetical protein